MESWTYLLTKYNWTMAITASPITEVIVAPVEPKIGIKKIDNDNNTTVAITTEIVNPFTLSLATKNWFPKTVDQPIKINSIERIARVSSIPSKSEPKYISENGLLIDINPNVIGIEIIFTASNESFRYLFIKLLSFFLKLLASFGKITVPSKVNK